MRLEELFEAKDAAAAHELINTHGDADMDHAEIVELLVGNGFDRKLAVTIASDYRPLDEGIFTFGKKHKISKEDLIKQAKEKHKKDPEHDFMVIQDKKSKLFKLIDEITYIMTPIPSRSLIRVVYNTAEK